MERQITQSDMDIPPPETPVLEVITSMTANNLEKILQLADNIGATTTTFPEVKDETVHVQEEPDTDTKKRFKTVDANQQKIYQDANHSESTKKNTSWALKLFQDWHHEVYPWILLM
ncbi:uncharacterized protein LOC110452147 [Mizuhopecten yessoensis]|uniref:uncharacterized protein LOC110452147 n=1 Tax=Mizuhopecten yessoensis TaxID=6573 RepID=UPI000B45F2DD|nr:uncharacterized protein LOC110452147 [Mizuhopecten yessoensis]